jgi:hypothetical protein
VRLEILVLKRVKIFGGCEFHTFSFKEAMTLLNLIEIIDLCSRLLLVMSVPHSKSGVVPRSSLLGAGQLGFGEFGKGGTIG